MRYLLLAGSLLSYSISYVAAGEIRDDQLAALLQGIKTCQTLQDLECWLQMREKLYDNQNLGTHLSINKLGKLDAWYAKVLTKYAIERSIIKRGEKRKRDEARALQERAKMVAARRRADARERGREIGQAIRVSSEPIGDLSYLGKQGANIELHSASCF